MNTLPFQFKDFVGREEELKALLGHIQNVKKNGSLILIEGETGVGKTRFVSHALEQLGDDFISISGKCMFGERADPYLPIYQILSQCLKSDVDKEIKEQIEAVLPSHFLKKEKIAISDKKESSSRYSFVVLSFCPRTETPTKIAVSCFFSDVLCVLVPNFSF